MIGNNSDEEELALLSNSEPRWNEVDVDDNFSLVSDGSSAGYSSDNRVAIPIVLALSIRKCSNEATCADSGSPDACCARELAWQTLAEGIIEIRT